MAHTHTSNTTATVDSQDSELLMTPIESVQQIRQAEKKWLPSAETSNIGHHIETRRPAPTGTVSFRSISTNIYTRRSHIPSSVTYLHNTTINVVIAFHIHS